MRPAALDELGTGAALEALVERVSAAAASRSTSTSTSTSSPAAPAERHEAELETAVYRIVQEALNNAVKHAGVETVVVSVHEHEGQMAVEVTDAVAASTLAADRRASGSSACASASKRSAARSTVDSAPGAGTKLSARFPARRRGAPVSERAAG